MNKFARSILSFLLVFSLASQAYASSSSIWGATDRGPALGTYRIPVDTSSSSGPGYITPAELSTYLSTTSLVSFPLGSGLTITPGTQNATPLISGSTLYGQLFPNTYTSSHTITAIGDSAGLAIYNNTSAGTFTLPQAGTTGFESGVSYSFLNVNTGALTLTTTTSVFKGMARTGSNIVLAQYGNAICTSDGTDWNCAGGGGAGGSVSVTAASANIVVNPTPGTGTFTVGSTAVINNQTTATSYTVLSADGGTTIKFIGGSSAVAVSLPYANTGGFTAGFGFSIHNFDTSTVTLTPTTSTINGASTLIIYPNEEADIISDGTNYIATVAKIPTSFINFQPGLMTTVISSTGVYYKAIKNTTVDNIVGSAISFTCTGNPTITMYECGASMTCASPTTIGTVTITANATAVDGTVSNGTIAAGHYVGWAITAGTCTALNLSATAQIHQN